MIEDLVKVLTKGEFSIDDVSKVLVKHNANLSSYLLLSSLEKHLRRYNLVLLTKPEGNYIIIPKDYQRVTKLFEFLNLLDLNVKRRVLRNFLTNWCKKYLNKDLDDVLTDCIEKSIIDLKYYRLRSKYRLAQHTLQR